MLGEEVVRDVLGAALADGGDLAEIYVENRTSSSFRLEDRRIEDVSTGDEAGAGLRIVAGERTAYAHTNVLTQEALLRAAEAARAGIVRGATTTVADLTRTTAMIRHPVEIDLQTVDATKKVEALQIADESARNAGDAVRQVTASYAETTQRVLIANSRGVMVEDDRTRVRFAVNVVAGRDGEIATGFEAPGHSGGFELLERRPPAELASSAAGKALRMLEARPAPAGEFPVVLAPGAGGVLIHEACGHGLEADTLVKDASVYARREGERFGSDGVNIVDDGSVIGAWGSFGVDDEGTPAQRTMLFEAGVLVGHMSDVRSAGKIAHPPTGNARRQSYAHLPIVRMTNTYLLSGPDERDDIISSVERGVYAAAFAGGEVNPATGNFVFGMSEAYMIENGEITYPIKGATLIGNGPAVLGAIDAIADDFDSWDGVCGKDGQRVPVTSGQPTVLLRSMTVGGTSA